jgi:hypothetical protein
MLWTPEGGTLQAAKQHLAHLPWRRRKSQTEVHLVLEAKASLVLLTATLTGLLATDLLERKLLKSLLQAMAQQLCPLPS